MTYTPIIFNEGEPLDVTKLNQLDANVRSLVETSDKLKTSIDGQPTVSMISDMGREKVSVVAGKVNSSIKITPDATLVKLASETNPIRFFVSMSSTPKADQQVTFSATTATDGKSATVHVISTKSDDLYFNWYASVNSR